MAKLTAAILHDSLDAGQSVAEIADACDVSPCRVYQCMRRLGRSATEVRATPRGKLHTSAECRTLDGYRVTGDGRVQSCWSAGCAPVKTPHWRDLKISHHEGRLFVQLGGTAGRRRRLSLRTIYRDVRSKLRESQADDLYETKRREILGG